MVSKRFAGALMMLVLGAPVHGQNSVTEPRSDASTREDVIVVGNRHKRVEERKRATEYVVNVSQAPVSGQFARWREPICTKIFGLEPQPARLVESRMARVAADAGIGASTAGCRPNLIVIFTRDGDAALKSLEQERIALPDSLPLEEKRAIRAPKQPVRLWTTTEIRGPDEEAVGFDANRIYSASLIRTSISAAVPAAMVVVDVVEATGKKLSSIADYAAFMVIGRTRPVVDISTPTIARLFDDGCPTCDTLTSADRRYLAGLYSMPNTRPARATRSGLIGKVVGNH